MYFSFGNHDKGYYDESYRGYNGDDLIKELEKNNVTVLQDENVLIDDRIYIVGRQDYSEVEKGGTRADMDELVKNLDTDKYIVVMDHQPHDYDNQEKAGVDMVLSGHTHGGSSSRLIMQVCGLVRMIRPTEERKELIRIL